MARLRSSINRGNGLDGTTTDVASQRRKPIAFPACPAQEHGLGAASASPVAAARFPILVLPPESPGRASVVPLHGCSFDAPVSGEIAAGGPAAPRRAGLGRVRHREVRLRNRIAAPAVGSSAQGSGARSFQPGEDVGPLPRSLASGGDPGDHAAFGKRNRHSQAAILHRRRPRPRAIPPANPGMAEALLHRRRRRLPVP